ncbi:MAG: YpdA family putative bacillithiol disulfide reductase [Acidobacteria bacterium]|nr:YpdA family putative bacillithiol disulfide reductase [Acidobacteriota bacterium]
MSETDRFSDAANSYDVLVIGAGPTGMACAIAAQRAGFKAVLVDKGCLCNSLFHYPAHMTFFTTPELLEIGDMPFSSPNQKPNRNEALEYYRKVAEHYQLDVRQYETVEGVMGSDGDFAVDTTDRFGRKTLHHAKKLVVATGYYDLPNYLNIPGEDLSKVRHYYHEPHPFYGLDVVVIGGKNSAAIAALDLWRHGAKVTLVHRGPEMHRHVKYWILPDINNRVKNGEITAYFNSSVTAVREDDVTLATPEGEVTIPNHFVFALTGYHPDFGFIERLGVRLDAANDRCPVCDPATLESNVAGIYLAGVIVAGERTNEIFIENGRFHGKLIADDLKAKLGTAANTASFAAGR